MSNKRKNGIIRFCTVTMSLFFVAIFTTACSSSKSPSEEMVNNDLNTILADKNMYARLKSAEISKSLTEKDSYEVTYDLCAETKYADWKYQVDMCYKKYDQGWKLAGTNWNFEEYEQVRFPSVDDLEAIISAGEDPSLIYLDEEERVVGNGEIDNSNMSDTGLLQFTWSSDIEYLHAIHTERITSFWQYDVDNDTWVLAEYKEGHLFQSSSENEIKEDVDFSGKWTCMWGTNLIISNFTKEGFDAEINGEKHYFFNIPGDPWVEDSSQGGWFFDGNKIYINFDFHREKTDLFIESSESSTAIIDLVEIQ